MHCNRVHGQILVVMFCNSLFPGIDLIAVELDRECLVVIWKQVEPHFCIGSVPPETRLIRTGRKGERTTIQSCRVRVFKREFWPFFFLMLNILKSDLIQVAFLDIVKKKSSIINLFPSHFFCYFNYWWSSEIIYRIDNDNLTEVSLKVT